ncbi:hypothetical protein BXY41_12157 [Lacrimispora xylanisolvens]|jgi:hypothetical protein|uniref:Uncharacterized protein n=1 Tax=Lacrimispora xylanisolvens TaxID=384636 RepID=A0A2S6HCL5_9FIRM|nr:hypothetical protein [Hungatella xylanolytica]PPK75151.1 hypothetical protein BXY41_12157 [Hungatella xylanolytica]
MGTYLGLLFIVGGILYINQKNKPPRYGTQEYLDWKYKDYPGGGEYMKSIEKKSMTCTYGDMPLNSSEKTAYNKHEKDNGGSGIVN